MFVSHPKQIVLGCLCVSAVVGLGVFVYVGRVFPDGVQLWKQARACEQEVQELNSVTDLVRRGDAYFGGEEYDIACARAAYARAVAIDPRGSATVWHQFGRTDFLMRRFDDAIFKLQKQHEYFGDTIPNVHYMLGLTYGYRARTTGNTEDWSRAEEAFTAYIALDPISPWARTDLAWVYFAQGKFEEMKKPLEEGMRTSPTHPWLLNMYGLALLNTGDPEGAYEFFVAALGYAQKLTPREWGDAYPGNDPAMWPETLAEFVESIAQNAERAEQQMVAGE